MRVREQEALRTLWVHSAQDRAQGRLSGQHRRVVYSRTEAGMLACESPNQLTDYVGATTNIPGQ